ncbi:MAG TPA: alcohol dehydrogenase catalytic domain-containing protein [Spongiibacteraceae bacterium]|nr:alcohol dehydrogenase catalytic domain-containing protein [Spongiibacteraceae bacterium]
MKAAYLFNGEIKVGEVADPTPAKGQVLVRTCACGLCASDVHFLNSGPKLVERSQEYGGPYANVDLSRPFVPGHEFVGEIIDYGPGSARKLKIGTRVTSVPVITHNSKHSIIGYSGDFPGGFGEYMLLDEEKLMEVPTALDDDRAAMIEPLAVGLEHARAGEPNQSDVALVIGCGAIGLGVIAGLKLLGIAPIIAADFDAGRREIALQMGADIAVDPREMSPYAPMPTLGMRRPTIVYECVGVPGLLNEMMRAVGFGAKIVMGGFCIDPEEIFVPCGQMKRLKIHFACGEEQQDLDLALRAIADGRIDVTPWLSGPRIGLSGVADALEKMKSPTAPVRTVVDPRTL